MSQPQQFFQLYAAEYIPLLQRNPVNARPVRGRHNSRALKQFVKSLRPGSERQYCSPIFFEVELREHLAAILLRSHAKNQLVTPPRRRATALNNLGK